MLTREQLADELKSVNVAEVAKRAQVAEKTIYRLRHAKHAPNLDTAARILRAIEEIKADEAKAA